MTDSDDTTIPEWLKDHGPATNSESPFTSLFPVSARRKGVRVLGPQKPVGHTRTTSVGGQVTKVYYLPEHTPEEILKRFLEANPEWTEMNLQERNNLLPKEFHEASRNLRQRNRD